MTMTTTDALAELATWLATGAAEVITGLGRASLDVSAKSTPTDLVTAVDTAAERWLVARIAEQRPADAVLGEEGGGRAGRSGVRWLLDPIDGTVNFVLGIPQYAVSVAAEVDGAVVAGAVRNVVSGELFHARRGQGAFLGGTRLSGPREIALERSVIGTGFAYDRDVRTRQAAVAAELLGHVGDIRRLGSSSLDLCAVAAGRLDGYYEAGLHVWDYAAGALIASEGGCDVSDLRGGAPSPRMAAASGPTLARRLYPLLERLGAGEVSSSARPSSTA
jgi:myo-inositol-1(or 4)-monophosphatase